jgi:hypothetical protein
MPARHVTTRSLACGLLLLMVLLLGASWVGAQDAPPTEPPTLEPTAIPPTEVPPTEVLPTVEPSATPLPTDIPTEVPTGAPTLAPTGEATSAPTVEPTVTLVLLPPAFSPLSAPLNAAPGQALAFSLTVSDETGAVRVLADTAGTTGAVTVEQVSPVETAAPFSTTVNVTYLAAAGFSGVDSFTLVAIDQSGLQSTLALQVTVGSLMTATPEPTATPTVEPTTAPGGDNELIISYNPNASEESIAALLASINAVEVSRIAPLGAMKVRVADTFAEPTVAMTAINSSLGAQTAGVTGVELNGQWSTGLNTNDPFFASGQMPGLNGRPSGVGGPAGDGIYADLAWDLAPTRGAGVIVAVIDSGILLNHPDLIGQYIPGYDFVYDDPIPDDRNGHGTHVAGTIAARANNAIGVVGVAFNARIMPLKACDAPFGFSASCFFYDTAAAIVYAADRGAQVINMSLGGPINSSTVRGAVDYALSRNVTIVASSGNSGTNVLNYPASYPGVISVGASDPFVVNSIADFSTFNSSVTVAAPGVGIISTFLTAALTPAYAALDGTSMAAPHVSGIAALIIGQRVATTPAAVREALICSALDRGAAGRDDNWGWGLVQADFALNWRFNSSDCKQAPVNDSFQGATRIITLPTRILQSVNARTVTASPADGTICGRTPVQSLWYTFTPAVGGLYQITTMGSSYDTVLAVTQGNQGAMRCVADNDDAGAPLGTASLLVADLQAGQPYFIMVDSFNLVSNQLLQLNINPVLVAPATAFAVTENNGLHIAYSGTWVTAGVPGALPAPSGLLTAQTSDNNAWALFTFRGARFDYFRSVGPDQGDVEIIVLGGSTTTISNNAPVRRGNQVAFANLTSPPPGIATVTTVAIRRRAAGLPGAIDIDRIQVYEAPAAVPAFVVSALTDDRDLNRFRYVGPWSPVNVLGSNANTAYQTSTAGSSITFQGVGSTFTIWRNTGPGFSPVEVYVDGRLFTTINNAASTAVRVPITFVRLGTGNHVIRLVTATNGPFQFDAAGLSSPVPLPASPLVVNENHPNLQYTGVWANLIRPGAFLNTTRRSDGTFARVNFSFTGNRFCARLVTQPGGALVTVGVGDRSFTWDTNAPTTSLNVIFCTPILYEGTHIGGMFATSGIFELDGVVPLRTPVLTPASGIVNETSPAFFYSGAWATRTTPIGGSSRYQGLVARTTSVNGSTVEFFINGSGFILYTSFAPTAGNYEVFVNGASFGVITLRGTSNDFLRGRFVAGPFVLSGLPPGINWIRLVKIDGDGNAATTEFADFDAIRVFP